MATPHRIFIRQTIFFITSIHCALFVIFFLSAIAGSLIPLVSNAAEDKVANVVEVASKAIVNIKTEELSETTGDEQKPSLVKRYFAGEDDTEELVENIGSGVVLDPKGIIVTNEHLITKAISIRVKFINGKEYDA